MMNYVSFIPRAQPHVNFVVNIMNTSHSLTYMYHLWAPRPSYMYKYVSTETKATVQGATFESTKTCTK